MPLGPVVELAPKVTIRLPDGSTQSGRLVADGRGLYCEWQWTDGKLTRRTRHTRREPFVSWVQITRYELTDRTEMHTFAGSGRTRHESDLTVFHASGQASWRLPLSVGDVRNLIGAQLAAIEARPAV